ncbi:hypothetical protein TA3x_000203 [Tundrisphaera sp. TA3]|uniref:hypothetical protein n=1 Tax=Tundrisphaera sp. TA3 TaxID=3435775 RepID=UPI003EB6E6F7
MNADPALDSIAMNRPMITVLDLAQVHPALRVFMEHYSEHEFGVLDGLWEVGGSVPGREPTRWLDKYGEDEPGRFAVVRGRVIADAVAAWHYLLYTDEEVLWASLCEALTRTNADPIRAVVEGPCVVSVTLARSHLVNDLGMDDASACRHLIDGAIERTSGLSEHRRESIVAGIQKAIRAIDSSASTD